MRRLYLQIYLAFVAVGIGSLIVSGSAASLFLDRAGLDIDTAMDAMDQVAEASADDLGPRLAAVARELEMDAAVWNADGEVIAATGDAVPYGRSGPFRRFGRAGWRMALPHGRRVGFLEQRGNRALAGLAWLFVLALAVAVGCYPVARRVTRRLELTGSAVQQWGAGDLTARAPVLGRDEVAQVAETFNAAAGEVERLFEAQRRVLASASHELRSPLARLRVAVQLAAEDLAPEGWTERAIADIEDLDATVGDLLQVGRMQALDGPPSPEDVDLHALVVDVVEGDVGVRGTSTLVRGDRRLLRRLVRNLVDNARRHGALPIVVTVRPDGLDVEDAGPGVDPAYEDRIFEPFVRLDHETTGVGLGLHLVREIARSHGGDVRYRRGDEGGSCFSVTLR